MLQKPPGREDLIPLKIVPSLADPENVWQTITLMAHASGCRHRAGIAYPSHSLLDYHVADRKESERD